MKKTKNQWFANAMPAILSACVTLMVMIPLLLLGAILSRSDWMTETRYNTLGIICLAVFAVILLCLFGGLIAVRRYKKSKEKSAREIQEYYDSRREEAINDLPHVVKRIVRLRRLNTVYTTVLVLCSVYMSFCIGIALTLAALYIIPASILYGYFRRLSIGGTMPDFSGCSDPKDYPTLHALAHRAAQALDQDGKIRIQFISECNAGIAKIGNTYSLQLGIQLLDILTEEELYQIMLHEFAHRTKDGNPTDREYRLFDRITSSPSGDFGMLYTLLHRFPDIVYAFEYFIYRQTASAAIEEIADRAIREHGDVQIATNALAKIAYHDYFDRYEVDDFIEEHYYASEERRENTVDELCNAFRRALTVRADFWKSLLMKEIQPRNASHPIFRNRMESLGAMDFEIVLPDESGEYRAECKRARETVNREIYDALAADYTERRREYYLKPMAIVEAWRASETPVAAEEAREILDTLWSLSLYDELEALCDRLIADTENEFATAHARMLKGKLLLRKYDKEGISHLYRAVEINPNYIETAMDDIGAFCCAMGLERELEEYRERAVELAQFKIDEYDKTADLTPSDNLSVDNSMPREMLDSILDYIRSIDEGVVTHIYLVRKTVSDDFACSTFVIRFKNKTDGECINRVMDKIFNHLDTRPEDHHFSLFYYGGPAAAAIGKIKGSCIWTAEGRR